MVEFELFGLATPVDTGPHNEQTISGLVHKCQLETAVKMIPRGFIANISTFLNINLNEQQRQ